MLIPWHYFKVYPALGWWEKFYGVGYWKRYACHCKRDTWKVLFNKSASIFLKIYFVNFVKKQEKIVLNELTTAFEIDAECNISNGLNSIWRLNLVKYGIRNDDIFQLIPFLELIASFTHKSY